MNNATLPALAFQTVAIFGKTDSMGFVLADGSVMLQRRGSSAHLEANVRGVNVAIHRVPGYNIETCELFYQRGAFGQQDVARSQFPYQIDDKGTLPRKLIMDTLMWIEERTQFRPKGFRRQRAAYAYDRPGNAADLVLQRFRYDKATRSIVEAQSGATVARASGDGSPFVFDPTTMDVLAADADVKDAIEHVLGHCYSLSDRQVGFNHCMHRLAGRASNAYARLKDGQKFEVFVLKSDGLSPATLDGLDAGDPEQFH